MSHPDIEGPLFDSHRLFLDYQKAHPDVDWIESVFKDPCFVRIGRIVYRVIYFGYSLCGKSRLALQDNEQGLSLLHVPAKSVLLSEEGNEIEAEIRKELLGIRKFFHGAIIVGLSTAILMVTTVASCACVFGKMSMLSKADTPAEVRPEQRKDGAK